MIAARGAALGIDVGYAPHRKTTGFCLLRWDRRRIAARFRRTTSDARARRQALADLAEETPWVGVGVDGPLAGGLRKVRHYRAAEALLSQGVLQRRGKPGQTSSPVGQRLHEHATRLARLALAAAEVRPATHPDPIHERCVVEAFPGLFLAALVPESRLPTLRRDASDRYWTVLEASGGMRTLLRHLLPGREIQPELTRVRDHDDRAALVCALSALCVAAGHYVAVGDPVDGDIVLPPLALWGGAADGRPTWLAPLLRAGRERVRGRRGGHPNHAHARIVVRPEGSLPATAT